MNTCPECLSQTPSGASVCPSCGRRFAGKECPACAEMAKPQARKCSCCGHDFARQQRVATVEPFQAKAALLPTLLLRGRLIPQEIHLNPDKVVIRTWGFFWLSRTDEDIPWEKIAGYHYRSGFFWDSVEIQTRGQKANVIGCLPKSHGEKIQEILERMKE